VARVHVDAEQHRRPAGVSRSRRRATYLAGSKYCTCESHRPVPTNIAGYACAFRLSYGEYDSM
jgi:hypothetical protein